jgi:amino acid transporter
MSGVSVAAARASDPERALVRGIGTLGLTAGIVNITVGGSIFRLPADVASSLGAAAPLAYLVCAAAMGLIALGFAEAGSRVSRTGGPYAYVEVAFGPFVGFLCGVLLWMLGTFALAGVSMIFTANVGQLVPAVSTRTGAAVFLAAVYAALAAVNLRGVRHGTRLNIAITIAKLLPLLVLAAGGLASLRAEHLAVTAAPEPGAVARASMLLIFAFAGVETALVPAGEVRRPERTVPRALLLAMVIVTVLYVWIQVVAQGILGPGLAGHPTPLAEAAGRSLGAWGRTLLLVGASVSMFGFVSGMSLAVPRALFALARDGFLPSLLASVHGVYRTPYAAIAAQSIIAWLFAVTSSFQRMAVLANLSVLLLYAACCLAAWTLRRRGVAGGAAPVRVPLGQLVPWLACAVIVWLLTSIRADEWAAVLITLAVAALLFALTRRRRAGLGESPV